MDTAANLEAAQVLEFQPELYIEVAEKFSRADHGNIVSPTNQGEPRLGCRSYFEEIPLYMEHVKIQMKAVNLVDHVAKSKQFNDLLKDARSLYAE